MPSFRGQKFGTALLLGVQIGKAGLNFYLLTPYSEARYRFYQAAKRFEEFTVEDALVGLADKDYALVVVLQDAAAENLTANLLGFGSLTGNTGIVKVVVKRGEIVYEPLGREGAGWAFPLGVFAEDGPLEIIAVSEDNLHAVVRPSGSRWGAVR